MDRAVSGVKDKHGQLIENNPIEMIGAVVDPDLLVLRSGMVVASFGVRAAPRLLAPRGTSLERKLSRHQSRQWGDVESRGADDLRRADDALHRHRRIPDR